MADITIETKPQGGQNGWLIFQVTQITGNVELEISKGRTKGVRAYLVPPDNQPILIAYQLFAGAETQPENTHTLLTLQDITANLLKAMEESIINSDKKGAW